MERRLDRRALLTSGVGLVGALAGCPSRSRDGAGSSENTGTPTDQSSEGLSVAVGAEPVATNLRSPVAVVAVEAGSYLVAEQPGRIRHVEDGEEQSVLLDLRSRVVDVSGYDERGLLGLALHPQFGDNGRLFVRYSAPPRAGTPDGYSHTFVLAEFAVDPRDVTAEASSERTILESPEPQSNHNAGDIVFGPDGLLYVPLGDGGGAGDRGEGHVEDWYDGVPGGNGQDVIENRLGSILRIDVDATGDGATRIGVGEAGGATAEPRPYGVPPDNPLVDEGGLDEHYAWGFRNPWRLSFGPDGGLYVADVGQNRLEEVNLVERGGNYGWNVREATACYAADECPTVTPDGERLRPPIVEYPHDGAAVSGLAVVGGYRYDGTAVPDLDGLYVFGDWQSRGRLFVAREDEDGLWPTATAPIESGSPGAYLLSFGRDPDGELLVCTSDSTGVGESGGAIHRLTEP